MEFTTEQYLDFYGMERDIKRQQEEEEQLWYYYQELAKQQYEILQNKEFEYVVG